MNMQRLVFFGIATAIPLSAQIQGLTASGAFWPSSVTGAPYSATQTTEGIQTLADGTHITQPGQETVMYRDSAGRTRNELTFPGPRAGDQPAPAQVTIVDPVAGFRYQLNLKDKVTQRFAMPAPRPATAQPRPAANAQGVAPTAVVGGVVSASGIVVMSGVAAPFNRDPRLAAGNAPKTTSESLGTQVIEGVTAEGTRRTTTWAVGTVGNDREIVVTNETWFSRQLQVTVLTKTSDPRSGETTTKLANISLAEPDPSLFMPPLDYTIKDVGAPAAP
jgi:hypothetical protein